MPKHKKFPSQRFRAVGVGDVQEIWKIRNDLGEFDPEHDGVIYVSDLHDPYEDIDIPLTEVDITDDPVDIGIIMDEKDFSAV